MVPQDPRLPPASRPAGDFGPSRRRLRPVRLPQLDDGVKDLHLLGPRPLHHWVEYGEIFRIAEELRDRIPGVALHLWLRSELRDASLYDLLPVDSISPLPEDGETPGPAFRLPLGWSVPDSESPAAREAGQAFFRALRCESPRWVSSEASTPVPIDRRSELRFLVHQARFHIGDALWLTPLLREIRRRFPNGRTTVVAPPAALAVLAGNPHVSEIVPYDGLAVEEARRGVLERLSSYSFAAAFFAFARRPESRWLAKAVNSRHRINLEYFDPALDWRRIPGWLTHEGWFFWGVMPSPLLLLHALEPLIGSTSWTDEDRRVEVHISEESRKRAVELLDARGFGGEPFAVVAPGGLSSRRWPVERFARLARRLAGELGLHVLVEGSPAEAPLLAEVAAQAGSAGPRSILAAADPLDVFAALLERAQLLLANDSAPIHFAEAAGTPCLYFAQREKLVHSHPSGGRCLALYDEVENDPRRITVEQAATAARAILMAGQSRGPWSTPGAPLGGGDSPLRAARAPTRR